MPTLVLNRYWQTADIDALELAAMIYSAALFLVYHVLLVSGSYFLPKRLGMGKNIYYRNLWVDRFMVTCERPPIDAVQTLRNGLMTASFLATTTIAVGVQTVNAALTDTFILSDFSRIKLAVVAGSFFLAFFFFTLNLRSLSHASYLVSVARPSEGWPDTQLSVKLRKLRPRIRRTRGTVDQVSDPKLEADVIDEEDLHEDDDKPEPVTQPPDAGLPAMSKQELKRSHLVRSVKKLVNEATVCFTFGLRCCYFTGPLALWVLGPVWFIVTSTVLVLVVFLQDYVA